MSAELYRIHTLKSAMQRDFMNEESRYWNDIEPLVQQFRRSDPDSVARERAGNILWSLQNKYIPKLEALRKEYPMLTQFDSFPPPREEEQAPTT